MEYKEAYEEWLSNPCFDEATKEELRSIAGDEKEIRERFYTDLEFGTAGLRGVIGAGTNRMNVYTVRRATQGLANYIKSVGSGDKGVVIAHDSRRKSPEFAREAALTLAANGIKAYLFDALRPTPELSFAVRTLGCTAGINITASHNPPEYNGYKVYWEDGAQITPPHDTGIMAEVKAVTDYAMARTTSREAAQAAGLYEVIGSEIDDRYVEALKSRVLRLDAVREAGSQLRIVYSPLHGTGNIPVRRVLRELGFSQVYVVPEQELPDGEFPTVSYPNPESDEAFTLGLELAREKGADLVLATDPDADRLGVRVRDRDGVYHALTGNMSGCLLEEYELSQTAATKGLPDDGAVVSTIVTTDMAGVIARSYGMRFIEVLTGFKYIGQQIRGFEESGKGTYLFGFEESYGCLVGTHARDKDAVVTTMALCEAAAYYRTQGKTLWDAMLDLYEKYGYYKDDMQSLTLKGIEGLEKIQEIMQTLRGRTPEQIAGYRVRSARDYLDGRIRDVQTGEITQTGLPSSNVLYYDLSDHAWLCVRPSGTEPKVKFYYGVRGTSLEDADEKSRQFGEQVVGMIREML